MADELEKWIPELRAARSRINASKGSCHALERTWETLTRLREALEKEKKQPEHAKSDPDLWTKVESELRANLELIEAHLAVHKPTGMNFPPNIFR